MPLIDDDQRKVSDGSENCRARAHDDSGFASLDSMPLLGTLAVRESGVQNGDLIAENLVQVGSHRRGQPDFRNQKNGRSARFKDRAHSGEINRGLSRTSNAMKQ